MPGRFIVIEGGDGSGKSTQVALLASALRADGAEVVVTREPGGTERGAAMRALLLDDGSPLDDRAELFLMLADRAQHVGEVIRPALERAATVICDRFDPSTLVYQGVARRLGVDPVRALCDAATGGLIPDRVVVLDVDDDEAERRRAGEAPDRIEQAGAAFHSEVRAAYRSLAERFGWAVVDGSGAVEQVAARVRDAVGR